LFIVHPSKHGVEGAKKVEVCDWLDAGVEPNNDTPQQQRVIPSNLSSNSDFVLTPS
jgi:hypothetical protein